MRWLALFIASGCTCVPDPTGNFPCTMEEECAPGFHCVAGRCSTGATDGGSSGCTKMGQLADCSDLTCAGQPCALTSLTRGICCNKTCVEPAANPNCGGCGNTCRSGTTCFSASTSAVVSGYCIGCSTDADCVAPKTCYGGGCVCHTEAECLPGQQCSSVMLSGMPVGVCWYPP